ncbi:MAG: HPr-rel-A system PqqD family peptide chaperone [Parasphingorhabdus sp.]|uniref:HPr-rel-A system PqqD family peptide chaperone n=1 Tax=Parasphingorhabdus sp. TaxID=2709688 RepID=UPI0032664B8C
MTPKYRAAAKDDLIWHGLDSMMLLFHRPSGITHMLADPAPAILEAMEDAVLTAPEIADKMHSMFDIESDADSENIILARLEELSALGLVSRVSGA